MFELREDLIKYKDNIIAAARYVGARYVSVGVMHDDQDFKAIDLDIITPLYKNNREAADDFREALRDSGVDGEFEWFITLNAKRAVLHSKYVLIKDGQWVYNQEGNCMEGKREDLLAHKQSIIGAAKTIGARYVGASKKYCDPEFEAIDLSITTDMYVNEREAVSNFRKALHAIGANPDIIWFIMVSNKKAVLLSENVLIKDGVWVYD